eukprot:IDg2546t1
MHILSWFPLKIDFRGKSRAWSVQFVPTSAAKVTNVGQVWCFRAQEQVRSQSIGESSTFHAVAYAGSRPNGIGPKIIPDDFV